MLIAHSGLLAAGGSQFDGMGPTLRPLRVCLLLLSHAGPHKRFRVRNGPAPT